MLSQDQHLSNHEASDRQTSLHLLGLPEDVDLVGGLPALLQDTGKGPLAHTVVGTCRDGEEQEAVPEAGVHNQEPRRTGGAALGTGDRQRDEDAWACEAELEEDKGGNVLVPSFHACAYCGSAFAVSVACYLRT